MRNTLFIGLLLWLASCNCYENKTEAISSYLKVQLVKCNSMDQTVTMSFSNRSEDLNFSIRRMAFQFQDADGNDFVRFLPVHVELAPGETMLKTVNFAGPRVFLGYYPLHQDIDIYCTHHHGRQFSPATAYK